MNILQEYDDVFIKTENTPVETWKDKKLKQFIKDKIKEILLSFPEATTIKGTRLCVSINEVDNWKKEVMKSINQ